MTKANISFVFLLSFIFISCTGGKGVIGWFDEAESPMYCSPFLSNGELTKWAKMAVQEGVGLQSFSHSPGYGNKILNTRNNTNSIIYLSDKEKKNSEEATLSIGGSVYIRETSDVFYSSLEELSNAMKYNHSDHIRYAETLAAVMVIYPGLQHIYYQ